MKKPPFENKPALGGPEYAKKPVEPANPSKPPYVNKPALGGPAYVKDEAWNPEEPWGKPFEPWNRPDPGVEPEAEIVTVDKKSLSDRKAVKSDVQNVIESVIRVVMGVAVLGLPLLGILAIFGAFTPRFYESPSTSSISNESSFSRGYFAEERLRNNLRDPNSLQVISKDVDDNGAVLIRYRAKNGFGGYTDDLYYEK